MIKEASKASRWQRAIHALSCWFVEPEVGFEPTTFRLRVGCATTTPLGLAGWPKLVGAKAECTEARWGGPGRSGGSAADGEAVDGDGGAAEGGLGGEEGGLEGEEGGGADGQAAVGLLDRAGGAEGGGRVDPGGQAGERPGLVRVDERRPPRPRPTSTTPGPSSPDPRCPAHRPAADR